MDAFPQALRAEVGVAGHSGREDGRIIHRPELAVGAGRLHREAVDEALSLDPGHAQRIVAGALVGPSHLVLARRELDRGDEVLDDQVRVLGRAIGHDQEGLEELVEEPDVAWEHEQGRDGG